MKWRGLLSRCAQLGYLLCIPREIHLIDCTVIVTRSEVRIITQIRESCYVNGVGFQPRRLLLAAADEIGLTVGGVMRFFLRNVLMVLKIWREIQKSVNSY